MEFHEFLNYQPTDRCTKCLLSCEDYLDNVFNIPVGVMFTCTGTSLFSCCGGKSGNAKWDNNAQQFKCVDCGAPTSTDPSYAGDKTVPPWRSPKDHPKCECGADKVYGPGNSMHSATMPCPLYRKY